MRPSLDGVLPESKSFFATPSSLARRLLLYQLYCGHFCCDPRYCTRRDNFNCYLLMYVAKGECYVRLPHRSFSVQEGELFFINCYFPHEYGCSSPRAETYWLHFDGTACADFFDAAVRTHGELFRAEESRETAQFVAENFERFLGGQPFSETEFSSRLYQELCRLLSCTMPSGDNETVMGQAVGYIRSHFREPLTVEKMAHELHMSEGHFSRLFKQQVGDSPYEYLVGLRIAHAKYLLKNTERSIAEIAGDAGFGSDTNFIYTFTRRVGMSPGKFRKLTF